MVNVRLVFSSARSGLFEFLDCETEIAKNRDCETFGNAKKKKPRLRDPENLTKILRDPYFIIHHPFHFPIVYELAE